MWALTLASLDTLSMHKLRAKVNRFDDYDEASLGQRRTWHNIGSIKRLWLGSWLELYLHPRFSIKMLDPNRIDESGRKIPAMRVASI